MWLLFQTAIIFAVAYVCTANAPSDQPLSGAAMLAGFAAWLATWLLSKAIDFWRVYRRRITHQRIRQRD
jgi:hypothetical protein